MNKTFLNIKIEGEPNIAIIDIGVVKSIASDNKRCDLIKKRLEPKIREALQDHFDSPVRIDSINIVSSLAPIVIKVNATIGNWFSKHAEESNTEVVDLTETWVY